MTKVHVLLINGGVMCVVDSKEKLVAKVRAAMCDESHIDVEGEEDEHVIMTIEEAVDKMYEMGETGGVQRVWSTEMLEMGDDYAEMSAHEREVE